MLSSISTISQYIQVFSCVICCCFFLSLSLSQEDLSTNFEADNRIVFSSYSIYRKWWWCVLCRMPILLDVTYLCNSLQFIYVERGRFCYVTKHLRKEFSTPNPNWLLFLRAVHFFSRQTQMYRYISYTWNESSNIWIDTRTTRR